MTRRSLRLATAAVLAAVALPLSACQTYQGTAAYVGDTRISHAQLDEQVDAFYADPELAKQAEGKRALVRRGVINALVILQMFKYMAQDEGVTVTQAQIDRVVTQLKQDPRQIPQQLQGAKLETAGAAVAYFAAIQEKVAKAATSQEDAVRRLDEAINKTVRRHRIEVNPRYGEFDPKAFNMRPASLAGVKDLPDQPGGQPDPNQPPQGDPNQPPQGDPNQPPQGDPNQPPVDPNQPPVDPNQPQPN